MRVFRNPLKKTGFLVHISFVSDLGLRFGKLQIDLDDFYSNFTDESDTAGTKIFKLKAKIWFAN